MAAQGDQDRVHALPIWHGRIEITPLSVGVASRTYLVRDGARQLVARCGRDVKLHGVVRSSEQAASVAAAAAGISPAVRHAGPGVLVIDYIEGRSLTQHDVRANRNRCVALVGHAHRELGQLVAGPAPAFDVFRVIAGYLRALATRRCRHRGALPGLAEAGEALRSALGPAVPVFGHNDLLACNFIDDGRRLWLIDWDYAGFNAPLFDLGGLSANNGFAPDDDEAMLWSYFGARADDGLKRHFAAASCTARLREALWSLVSEGGNDRGFDYAGYADANLAAFQEAYGAFSSVQSEATGGRKDPGVIEAA